MPARIAYVVGLAVAIALAACYDVPQPECGFTCGPPAVAGGEGTCPSGYVCFTSLDNRCHRVSPPFTEACPGDAGVPVDLTPPQLIGRSPEPDSTGVPITPQGIVEVVFNEDVAYVQFPNFVVEDPNGTRLLGSIVPTVAGASEWHFEFRSEAPFRSETFYTVRLNEEIKDLSGNAFAGATWSFTTGIDDTAPMAFVDNPVQLTLVPTTTTVDVSFSEMVTGVTTLTFTLTGPDGVVSAGINATSPTMFATLDPFANLLPNAEYTIALSNEIVDLAGNPLSFTPVTFTTSEDTIRPQVLNTAPVSGSTNVSVIASITAGFSEAVTNVTPTTFTLTGPSGTETALLTTSSTNATLNPIHQLVPFTTYTIALSTAIVDLASNQLVAFTGTFTTGADGIVPTVIGRSPTSGATNVPVDTEVFVDFDEDITNANATTIQLAASSAVPATVAYQGAPQFRATLTPSVQLAANTTYTMLIAPALQDTSGNMFGTPPGTWTFTTGADTVVPAVLSTLPVDDATGVAVGSTISVTFDEPVTNVDATSFVVMNGGTGTLVTDGVRTITFIPDAALPANTTITIMLTMAIEDAAGNALVPFTFDFTTAP